MLTANDTRFAWSAARNVWVAHRCSDNLMQPQNSFTYIKISHNSYKNIRNKNILLQMAN